MNLGEQKGFVILILVLFDVCSELKYLGHMAELYLSFVGLPAHLQLLVVSFHIAINSVQRLTLLDTILMLILNSHSKRSI